MSEKIFSISEAAEYLGVMTLTLRNWEKRGLIDSFRTPGGHRRFRKNILDKIKGINDRGSKLEETIKKLEQMELGNQRRKAVNKIITDLKDISEMI